VTISMRSLALYVHIPFCQTRCRYCDFVSSTGLEEYIPQYRDSLIAEFRGEWDIWQERIISSVFFGGGTPTLWDASDLNRVLEEIVQTGVLSTTAEISVEANPGTIGVTKLKALRKAGFNRLSIGAQCKDNSFLKLLGRGHTRQDVEAAIENARFAGFDNINLDLIYGLPGQSIAQWRDVLCWAIALKPEHLSCYALQVEECTPLAKDLALKKLFLPEESDVVSMMELTWEMLPASGYKQYEISNFAKAGYACRHNLAYWNGNDYLGLGAGAFSTVGNSRWNNSEEVTEYIKLVKERGTPPRQKEFLPERIRMVEAVMLGLRLNDGLDWRAFQTYWGPEAGIFEKEKAALINEGWLLQDGARLRLTKEGIPVSNWVLGRICEQALD
jgi:oxygen-independent coproporphyrinogen-3 oxidase